MKILPILMLTSCIIVMPSYAQGQPAPAAVERPIETEVDSDGKPVETAEEPKAPPPLAMSTSKIYSGGAHYSTLAKVNTGDEFIGLTVPAKYWFQAAENGRQITVYTDTSRRSAIEIRFHTNSFPEFTHETVWPMVSGYFDGLQPVFSKGSALGQAALVFTAESGSTINPKSIRSLVVPCEAGSISVTTEVNGDEPERVFYIMKQLATSLESAEAENELTRYRPTASD